MTDLQWKGLAEFFQETLLPDLERQKSFLREPVNICKDFKAVQNALIAFLKETSFTPEDQFEISLRILSLAYSDSQEADRKQGTEAEHREFRFRRGIALDELREIQKYGDDWIKNSVDISKLIDWIEESVGPGPTPTAFPEKGPLYSTYSQRLYEIVQWTKNRGGVSKIDSILNNLSHTLPVLFPSGLGSRKVFSEAALKTAYSKGQEEHS